MCPAGEHEPHVPLPVVGQQGVCVCPAGEHEPHVPLPAPVIANAQVAGQHGENPPPLKTRSRVQLANRSHQGCEQEPPSLCPGPTG